MSKPTDAASPWTAKVLTIFPEMLPGPLGHSLVGQALEDQRWSLEAVNIRDFATDRHKSVDDLPFGGGAGMVMRPNVVAAALDDLESRAPELPRLYLTPRGRSLTQERIEHLAKGPGVVVLCGLRVWINELSRRGLLKRSVSAILSCPVASWPPWP